MGFPSGLLSCLGDITECISSQNVRAAGVAKLDCVLKLAEMCALVLSA
jgi:hypothetical protein